MKKREDVYFVEVRNNGCDKCGHGRDYTIVAPDGSEIPLAWHDSEVASDVCEMINDAFQSGRATEREEAAEIAEHSTANTRFQTKEHYKFASFIAGSIRNQD